MMRPTPRGFTLLELLIAIAIFALLALGTYRMLESVLNSDAAVRRHELQLRELTRAIAALDRDLLQIIGRPIRDAYGEPRSALLGGERLQLEKAAIELTRSGWRNPLGAPRSQLQRVRWQLTGSSLQRLYWPVLDQATDSQPQVQKVLDGVTAIRVRFYDPQLGWQENWPPSDDGRSEEQSLGRLPQAVEVILTHSHYGELRRFYRLLDEVLQQNSGNQAAPNPDLNPTTPPDPSAPPVSAATPTPRSLH